MLKRKPVLATIPPPTEVHCRLGRALREVTILRALLRLAKRAEGLRRSEAQDSVSNEAPAKERR
jgi:hypothetical protein